MSIEQILDVPKNGTLTIALPPTFFKQKKVKVTINDFSDSLEKKIALMQKAAHDKQFLNDVEEVNKDFEFAETLVTE